MLAHQFFTLTARSAWSRLYDISDRAWFYLDRAHDILKSEEARQTYRAIASAFKLFVVFAVATGAIARIAADGLVARSLEQGSAPTPPVRDAVPDVVSDEVVVPDTVILEVQVPPIAKVAKKGKPKTAAKAKAGPSKGRAKAIKVADLV